MDTERFFVPGRPDDEVVAACARCAVKSLCLEASFREETKETTYGYRAGLLAYERNILRLKRVRRKATTTKVKEQLDRAC